MSLRARSRPGAGRRLLLVLAGALLGLGLVEIGLQILRATHLASLDRVALEETGGKVKILCAGDSHTYGLSVMRHVEDYPAQLERRLNEGSQGGFEVINLGFPGLNARQVLGELRRACEKLRPDLVLVLAGFNNSWNPEEEPRTFRWLLPTLWRLWFSPAGEPLHGEVVVIGGKPHIRFADGRTEPIALEGAREGLLAAAELERSVGEALREMVQFCRQHELPVVLQTYASEQSASFRSASEAARRVAAESGVLLVDHAAWFEAHPGENRFQPDGHPTAAGYAVTVDALVEHLKEWSGFQDLEAKAARAAEQATEAVTRPWISLRALPRQTDGTQRFAIEGPPEGVWHVYLSRGKGDGTYGLGLAMDETFARCVGTLGLGDRLRADGTGTAWVSAPLLAQLGEEPFLVQAVLVDPGASLEQMVLAASEVLRFDPLSNEPPAPVKE